MDLKSAVSGSKTAHFFEITLYFEFPVLTLTGCSELSRVVPGLRPWKSKNPLCPKISAPFFKALNADFRIKASEERDRFTEANLIDTFN